MYRCLGFEQVGKKRLRERTCVRMLQHRGDLCECNSTTTVDRTAARCDSTQMGMTGESCRRHRVHATAKIKIDIAVNECPLEYVMIVACQQR